MFHVLLLALFPLAALIGCLVPFRREIAGGWKELLLLACFGFVFMAGPLLNGEIIPQKDANLLQIPFLQNYQHSVWSLHQAPLLNQSLWLGTPSLAHPLLSALYPTTVLALALPVPTAFAWGLFGALFLSGVSMFLLMRTLSCGPGAALVASVTYSFGEFALDRMGAPTGPGVEYLHSFAFVPMAVALALRAVDEKRLHHAASFGLSLVFVMNGNPNLFYYALILCIMVLAARVIMEPSRAWFALAALGIGGIVMVLADAVELLPFYEFQQRAGGSRLIEEATGWRMAGVSWDQLGSLILPHLPPAHFGYAGRVGWVGLVLALLALGWWRHGDRRVIFMMSIAVAAGVLLVTHGFVFSLMADYLPLFRRISMIPSVFILFALPLSVLAGMGSQRLTARGMVLPIALALLIFGEGLGASRGWLPSTRFTRFASYDPTSEWNDFPHLDAVAPRTGDASWRIECRTPQQAMLCPDYAIIPRRLRLVEGDRYQFPTDDAKRLSRDAGRNRELLDVRYVLAPIPLDDPALTLRQTLRWSGQRNHREMGLREATRAYDAAAGAAWDGTVYVYESRRHLHAFLVEEGSAAEEIPEAPVVFDVTRCSAGGMEMSGRSPRPGILSVSEPYYPGWRATVDGGEAEVLRLESGLLGIAVGAQATSIVLRYDPGSFTLGFWITAISLSGTLVAIVHGLRRETSGPPPSS